ERFWVSSSSPGRAKVSFYEEVTYHACYDSKQDLIDAVVNFQRQINTNPLDISERLWVKKHLEPDEEKLRVSK
ncbi:MAG: hypothetical protein AAFQ80_08960, partial [Cyanobacteria bacterium J06621_8]